MTSRACHLNSDLQQAIDNENEVPKNFPYLLFFWCVFGFGQAISGTLSNPISAWRLDSSKSTDCSLVLF